MISVFIDDSGTSPDHNVAIAAALIVETTRIEALNKEFQELFQEEGFSNFHTSACVAGNSVEGFGGWDDEKKKRVCSRVRLIAMKYGVCACAIAIDRPLYDDVVPSELRKELGQFHYTWAVGFLIEMLDRWASDQRVSRPLKYVFDWMGKNDSDPAKKEIRPL